MVVALKKNKKTSRLKALFGPSWYELFKGFLLSEEFKKIARVLKGEIEQGRRLTPCFENMFRAFSTCPVHRLNTIIIGEEPYPGCTQEGILLADGLAFSSRTAKRLPQQLEHLYQAIDTGIYNGQNYDLTDSFDLTKWSEQGILLLNASLSTTVGNSSEHFDLWRPFIFYVLFNINKTFDNLGVIMMGRHAQAFSSVLTNETYLKLKCEHPSAASHTGSKWRHDDVFRKLDIFQEHSNETFLEW